MFVFATPLVLLATFSFAVSYKCSNTRVLGFRASGGFASVPGLWCNDRGMSEGQEPTKPFVVAAPKVKGGAPRIYYQCTKHVSHAWSSDDMETAYCYRCKKTRMELLIPAPTIEEASNVIDDLVKEAQGDPCPIHVRNVDGFPEQKELVESARKRKMVRAGRRGGKTTSAATLTVNHFAKGGRVLYAVPVVDQLEKWWKEVLWSLRELINAGRVYKNETEHVIEFRGTDNRIKGKTAWNADTLRGDWCTLLVLDEYQLMDETAWTEVGQPMMIDKDGDAVLIYTPPSLSSRSISKAVDKQHASKMFKRCSADPEWLCLHFSSRANPFLSKEGIDRAERNMSKLAFIQEIEAVDTDEVPNALWTRKVLDDSRVLAPTEWDRKERKFVIPPALRAKYPEAPDAPVFPGGYRRIVVAIDPSGSTTTEVGIVAAGEAFDGEYYILFDESMFASRPKAWAGQSIRLYEKCGADRIVAERNFGGDMVEETLKTVDENIPYKDIVSSRGKLVRAEPVSSLFEHNRAHMVGEFPELEDELVSYTGMPGERSPNRLDACFVKGTKVLTRRGNIPIEAVRVGDFAWTRQGWKRILKAGITSARAPVTTLQLSDRSITGTSSHPIWAIGKGFTAMDALVCGDTMLTCQSDSRSKLKSGPKPSIFKAFRTTDIRTASAAINAFIIQAVRMAELLCCTKPSGNIIVGRFRKAITYITSTMTHSTMRFQIMNAYPRPRTTQSFGANPAIGGDAIWQTFDRLHRNGTPVRKESLGTATTVNALGVAASRSQKGNVCRAMSPSKDSKINASAAEPACRQPIEKTTHISVWSCAPFAAIRSGKANIGHDRSFAPVYVLGKHDAGSAPVYNLEVEDAHEYFANGILVHNCVFAIMELLGPGALSLVELYKQGGMEKYMLPKTTAATSLASVATNSKTPKCPQCHQITLQNNVAGQIRCGHCGFQRPIPGQPNVQPIGGRRAIDLRK